MGIPEMLAQSSDSGMDGFMNSPIAMVLMPRTAARFQAAKKDQMLLEQYNRKVQLAGQFADQIEGQDPYAAAMIRSDPNAMDNVWTAMYNAGKQKELAGINFKNDMLKEAERARLAQEAELAKNNLPGAAGYYNKMMGSWLNQTVQPSGVMANPSVQGPRPAGELQQGQTVKDIDPAMMAVALGEDFKLPGLAEGDALRIMTDPTAVQNLQTAQASVDNREDMQKAEVDKINLQFDNDVEKTLEARKFEQQKAADAAAKSQELAKTFFGGEVSSTVDSVATQTQKWREFYNDPKITATEARRLTTAFSAGLSSDKPDQNAALEKANAEYGKLRPAVTKTEEVKPPGAQFTATMEDTMAKKIVPEAIAAGNKAAGAALDLTILKSALKTAPQGWNPEALVASYVTGYSGSADTVTALVNTMVPKLHEPGSGATSDLEFSSFRAALPQLMKTPEGNQAIVAIMERKNDLVRRRSKIAGDLAAGKYADYKVGAQALMDLDQESLITPELESTLAKAGVTISADGGAGGDVPEMPQSAKDAGLTAEDWLHGDKDTWGAFQ